MKNKNKHRVILINEVDRDNWDFPKGLTVLYDRNVEPGYFVELNTKKLKIKNKNEQTWFGRLIRAILNPSFLKKVHETRNPL